MNMITQCDIYVYMDWPEDAEPVYMGVLHSETIRGKEVFSYENDPAWLTHPRFRALDPDLSAFTGKQYHLRIRAISDCSSTPHRIAGGVRLCAGGKPSTPGSRTENRERLPKRIPDGRV